jgi:hypothetical protein
MRPATGTQTDRRIREFLFDLSMILFENNVWVMKRERNRMMKFNAKTDMKNDILKFIKLISFFGLYLSLI